MPVPPEQRGPRFESAFDSETLWYDAVRLGDRIHLVCPRLLNLRGLFTDASLSLDGSRVTVDRIQSFRRHEIVTLRGAGAALTVTSGRWSASSAISPDQTDLFAGLNTAVTMSLDNDLRWIADWTRFHIDEHGLEAALVLDNGSTAYPPQAIVDTLAATGLTCAVVIPVPQSYGPVPEGKGTKGAHYLQTALLNLTRLRFLSRAHAVLNADVDELVWSAGSVFDLARQSPFGLALYAGQWMIPGPDAAQPYSHADHIYPEAGASTCPTKYCIRPDGLLRGLQWDVHRPETRWPIKLLTRKDAGYWHCRGITTNWKSYDRLRERTPGPVSRDAATRLKRLA